MVGKLRERHFFSGLEGAWLCLMNSGAALASWGAIFTCLGAQRAAFFRFRECLVVVAEFRGGLCILGNRFSRAEGAWMERQGSEGGISSRPQGALSLQSSMGGIFSKGCHFSEQVSNCSSVITQKRRTEGRLIWYQGRRHRQKRFWSGKRAPSRTRRASFFVGMTPKRTKMALLWKERVRLHWPKRRRFCSEGRHICSKERRYSQVKKVRQKGLHFWSKERCNGRKGRCCGEKDAVTGLKVAAWRQGCLHGNYFWLHF